jgi:ABC-type bacteriocin/lantibiotic exporter with double-glycine peptidase domain
MSRELTSGELLSFYALIGYFTGPASSLIGANKSIQDALIAADRLFEIIDLETEGSNETQISLTKDLIGDIQFNNIYFRYGTRNTVFEGLSITIKKGASTAIVGESGSGKSTLLSLMQNLYPLKEGNITIGGIDIKYITNSSLRKMVSVVPQQIDLFVGTIVENIAIGEFEPDLQKVLNISKQLGIDEFVEKMPATYNTILHENGVNLSGGQRQRLAIARALYRNPEILILDEVTASLDSVSEQKVQETLDWFKSLGKTVIIIAHRLSTIKNCDDILVLQEGKLIEQGKHDELLLKKQHYFTMWNRFSGFIGS